MSVFNSKLPFSVIRYNSKEPCWTPSTSMPSWIVYDRRKNGEGNARGVRRNGGVGPFIVSMREWMRAWVVGEGIYGSSSFENIFATSNSPPGFSLISPSVCLVWMSSLSPLGRHAVSGQRTAKGMPVRSFRCLQFCSVPARLLRKLEFTFWWCPTRRRRTCRTNQLWCTSNPSTIVVSLPSTVCLPRVWVVPLGVPSPSSETALTQL